MSFKPTTKDYRAILAYTWTVIVAAVIYIGLYLIHQNAISVENLIALLSTPLTLEAVVLDWYFKAKDRQEAE